MQQTSSLKPSSPTVSPFCSPETPPTRRITTSTAMRRNNVNKNPVSAYQIESEKDLADRISNAEPQDLDNLVSRIESAFGFECHTPDHEEIIATLNTINPSGLEADYLEHLLLHLDSEEFDKKLASSHPADFREAASRFRDKINTAAYKKLNVKCQEYGNWYKANFSPNQEPDDTQSEAFNAVLSVLKKALSPSTPLIHSTFLYLCTPLLKNYIPRFASKGTQPMALQFLKHLSPDELSKLNEILQSPDLVSLKKLRQDLEFAQTLHTISRNDRPCLYQNKSS